jgi:hypothetical protein
VTAALKSKLRFSEFIPRVLEQPVCMVPAHDGSKHR